MGKVSRQVRWCVICVLLTGSGCERATRLVREQPTKKADDTVRRNDDAVLSEIVDSPALPAKPPLLSPYLNEPGWNPRKGFNAINAFLRVFTGRVGKRHFPNQGSAPIALQWIVGDLDQDNDIDDHDVTLYRELRNRDRGGVTAQASAWIGKQIPMFRDEMIDQSSLRQVTKYGLVVRLPYAWVWIYNSIDWRDSSFTYNKVFDTQAEAEQDLADFEKNLTQNMADAKKQFRVSIRVAGASSQGQASHTADCINRAAIASAVPE